MITFSELGKWGRLGNSLFEIAATISLALKNNDSYGFPNWEYKDHFNLNYCYFNSIKVEKIYKEPCFQYKEIPYSKNLDLRGYFQSEKYFIEYKDLILDLLSPKYEVKPESGSCGIHVRRGDYLSLKDCYHQLDMLYYSKAIDRIKAKKYIIFSDDINWCKNNFKGSMFEFSESKTPYEDLAIMSKRCENLIIANSSFSWWGAYLNNNPNKIIIAPQKWFGPKLPHNIQDLLPSEWYKI